MKNKSDSLVKRSRGGQPGNCNGLRTGAGLPTHFDIGRVPLKLRHIKGHVSRMVAQLQAAALANGSPIGPWQLGLLQECGRHELRARLLNVRFVEDYDRLTIEQSAMLLREIGNATHSRNRCLERLGLDVPQDAVSIAFSHQGQVLAMARPQAPESTLEAS